MHRLRSLIRSSRPSIRIRLNSSKSVRPAFIIFPNRRQSIQQTYDSIPSPLWKSLQQVFKSGTEREAFQPFRGQQGANNYERITGGVEALHTASYEKPCCGPFEAIDRSGQGMGCQIL
jgi:hypothetical protein